MGAEPADVLADLRGDIGLEGVAHLVGGAGEHEVVPDDQASLVAHIVEEVVREIAAAPDADAVVVGLLGRGKQHVRALSCLSGEDIVLRDIVRAQSRILWTGLLCR